MTKIKLNKKKVFWIFLILMVGVVGALVYDYSGVDLSSGDYDDTFYNSSESGFVQLNSSNGEFVSEGYYTSDVIDFGSASTGFIQISWTGSGECPENMSYIDKMGGYCIDNYEASKPDATDVSTGSDTSMAVSREGVLPWVSVTQTAASTACANAGKHLCTSAEWLGAANVQGEVYNLPSDLSGSPYNCNTNSLCGSSACVTGYSAGCVSSEGVYDMVGNVREWNSEVVDTVKPCNEGSNGWCYPQDDDSWGTSGSTKYGGDGVYFLANNQTGRAVTRGGNWDNGADAGPFYAYLSNVPGTSRSSLGFRCCSSSVES